MKIATILKIVGSVFFLVGLSIGGVGFALYSNTTSFLASAETAEAKLTGYAPTRGSEGGTLYAPIIEYRLKGQKYIYTSRTSSSSRPYAVGDTVKIYYDPARPDVPTIDSFADKWLGTMVCAIIGGVFGLIGGGLLLVGIFNTRKIKQLQRTGSPVMAKVTQVGMSTSVRINGRHPYQIVAQWQDPLSGKLHVFKSTNLDYDPSQYVADEIEVLIDRNNPKRHWVNISQLPELA